MLIRKTHKDGVNRPGETQFETQHAFSDVTAWFSGYLTLRLLISYIYGAPSKAINANVVYIWT